jgi:hypothetical protein
MLICFSLNASPSIPLVGLNPHSKNSFWRELFLAKVHILAELILLFINEVMKAALHKYSLADSLIIRFRRQYLLDFVVNWILFYLAKPKISGINRPVVRSLLLLSWIIILM